MGVILLLVLADLSFERCHDFVDGAIDGIGRRFREKFNVVTREVTMGDLGLFLDREIPIEIQVSTEVLFQLFRFLPSDFIDACC